MPTPEGEGYLLSYLLIPMLISSGNIGHKRHPEMMFASYLGIPVKLTLIYRSQGSI